MKPFSIMLFVGALFVAIAVLTSHWMGGGDGHGGLYSSVYCRESGDCESEFFIKFLFKGGGARITLGILLGIIVVLGGLGTAVLAGISGAITMNGRRGPAQVALIVGGVTGFLGLVFLGLMHGISPGDWGFSVFLFLIGTGLVVGGSLMAMSAIPGAPRMMMMPGMMQGMPGMPMMPQQGYQQQMMLQQQYAQQQQMQYAQMQQQQFQQPQQQMQPPAQQQMAPPQPQQMQQPNCNQCGGPTVWNGQVGKLFCQPCNRFVA